MSGSEKTRHAIAAQPEWLARVPTDRRLPPGRRLFTGCGTSFHAAQTGGEAVQALELVLVPRRDLPTAQEAVLKLREGVHVAAEAWQTEQLLHGHLAAVDETVRAFVVEGEGRAAERGRDAAAALDALGAPVTLVPTRHPVVDIVPFQLLAVDLAEDRGIDPDPIRRDDPRWAHAREPYA